MNLNFSYIKMEYIDIYIYIYIYIYERMHWYISQVIEKTIISWNKFNVIDLNSIEYMKINESL